MSLVLPRPSARGEAEEDRADHPLNAARGIMIGCAVGVALWAGIIALVVSVIG